MATSSDCIILVWSYDSFKLKGAWWYQNSEIRRFEFLENQLVIISIDAKGFLIFWDLRAYRTFNFYLPFIKIHLKPENGANLIVNNMLLLKIQKNSLFSQTYNEDDAEFMKFIKRHEQKGFRRSSSLISVNSYESK